MCLIVALLIGQTINSFPPPSLTRNQINMSHKATLATEKDLELVIMLELCSGEHAHAHILDWANKLPTALQHIKHHHAHLNRKSRKEDGREHWNGIQTSLRERERESSPELSLSLAMSHTIWQARQFVCLICLREERHSPGVTTRARYVSIQDGQSFMTIDVQLHSTQHELELNLERKNEMVSDTEEERERDSGHPSRLVMRCASSEIRDKSCGVTS